MKKQKDALLSLIKECLNMKEPINPYSTQQPKYEHRNLEFQERHQKNIQKVINSNLTKAIISDSITQIWPSVGEKSWNKYNNGKFINLGIGYDIIENVLYRVYHDEIEIECINLDKIILLIGTNNIGLNNNTEIVNGIKFLVNQIHIRQPGADLFVLGIFAKRRL